MQKKLFTLILLIYITIFTSCTIEKRTYMKGFHIKWKYSSKEFFNTSNEINEQKINAEVSQNNEIKKSRLEIIDANEDKNQLVSKTSNLSIKKSQIIKLNNSKNNKPEEQILRKKSVKNDLKNKLSKKNKTSNGLLAKDNEKFGKGWFYVLIALLIVGVGFFARALSQTYLLGNIFFIIALVLFIYGIYLMIKYA